MALPLVNHPFLSLHQEYLPPYSFRARRFGLLHRFIAISSSSHNHRHHLSIFQAMKSSVDLNNEESINKEHSKRSIDPRIQLVPSSESARLPLPNIPVWARWALGSLLCLALPFYKRILRIEDGVEKTVETVVKTVEKVAEVTGKVASEIADALPEGSLKQTAMEIEDKAEEVDKGAEKVEAFLDKVDKIEDEVKDLVEPIIDEAESQEKHGQVQNEASLNTNLPNPTAEPNDK